jgi:hypothetical protein
MRVMLSVGGVLLGPAPLHPARTRGTISACTTSRVMRPSAHLKMVRLTLELSCEASVMHGFVSFNSLFCGPARSSTRVLAQARAPKR